MLSQDHLEHVELDSTLYVYILRLPRAQGLGREGVIFDARKVILDTPEEGIPVHVGEQHVQALRVVIVVKDRLPIGVVLGANLARQVNQDEPCRVELIRDLLKVLYLVVEGVIEVEEDDVSRKLGAVSHTALCP